jgi:hypothetical protein
VVYKALSERRHTQVLVCSVALNLSPGGKKYYSLNDVIARISSVMFSSSLWHSFWICVRRSHECGRALLFVAASVLLLEHFGKDLAPCADPDFGRQVTQKRLNRIHAYIHSFGQFFARQAQR